MTGPQNARKHSLNQRFFQEIKSEAQSYFLGLLMADGWINLSSGTVGLTLVDKDLVSEFKNAVESSVPVRTRPYPNRPACLDRHELIFASKQMIEDLGTHGCTPKKSLTLTFPTTIPTPVLHHFVRGYFDGDGCVQQTHHGNHSVDIVGTETFLNDLQGYFATQIPGFNTVKVCRHGRIHRLVYHGNFRCCQLRPLFYKNATIWLDLKKRLFDSIVPRYSHSWRGTRKVVDVPGPVW